MEKGLEKLVGWSRHVEPYFLMNDTTPFALGKPLFLHQDTTTFKSASVQRSKTHELLNHPTLENTYEILIQISILFGTQGSFRSCPYKNERCEFIMWNTFEQSLFV